MQRGIEAEVASAIEVYRRLMEAAPAGEPDLAERGAEVAAIAEMAYREGAATLVELLDARRAHADARAAAATRAAELALARIELARALGAPLEE
jgi:outer membrane protein TolC